eukprot:scaffold473_cov156-Amphora_coffeaeformis.AAC.14
MRRSPHPSILVLVISTLLARRGRANLDRTISDSPEDAILSLSDELTRDKRFPSVKERVKLYMGNWYTPPCGKGNRPNLGWVDFSYENSTETSIWPSLVVSHTSFYNSSIRSYRIESIIEPDRLFFLDKKILLDCLDGEKGGKGDFNDRVQMRNNMLMYCYDAAGSLETALDHVLDEAKPNVLDTPSLVQFGDLKHSHVYGDVEIPHFKKFRSATTQEHLALVTPDDGCVRNQALQTVHTTTKLQPILWKFATARHFRALGKVYREDTPWEQKIPQAVFRGQLTGSRDGYDKHSTDLVNCMNLRRCRLVYTHSNSKLIDAKLTSTRNRMPVNLNGVALTAAATTIRRLLEFKAIIMLEGNDVASGLKWALLSQSVVLMPPPMHTSWAMEYVVQN